jgi:hypothetical protein
LHACAAAAPQWERESPNAAWHRTLQRSMHRRPEQPGLEAELAWLYAELKAAGCSEEEVVAEMLAHYRARLPRDPEHEMRNRVARVLARRRLHLRSGN